MNEAVSIVIINNDYYRVLNYFLFIFLILHN